MPWQFTATDLNGNTLGDLTQASARSVYLPLMRVPTLSVTLPMTSDMAPLLAATPTMIQATRIDPYTNQKDLAFNGYVVSSEESVGSEGQTIAVNAAGPLWLLSKRIIPISTMKGNQQIGSESSLQNLGNIAYTILSDVNGYDFTGIEAGTNTCSNTGWYSISPWKIAAEAINELCSGLNTFEYHIQPTYPTASGGVGGWPTIGRMHIADKVGEAKPDLVFEYGVGLPSIAGYSRPITKDSMANSVWISVQGWPDGIEKVSGTSDDKYSVQHSNDTTSISTWHRFDDVVNDAGILDDNLRKQVADYHVLARKQPKQQITFTTAQNARPSPLVDYVPGDVIRARAVIRGDVRFDALFRIWGMTINIDENGNESVDLELVMP